MWGKILVCSTLISLFGCHGSAITCDPNSSTPGCPGTRVCDPTGICQIQCISTSDCHDPGATVCDLSSGDIALCQTDCSTSLCQTGQKCLGYNYAPTSAGDATTSQKTCKQTCTDFSQQCAASSPFFKCRQPDNTQLGICWGALKSSTSSP